MLLLRWRTDLFPLYLSLFILQMSRIFGYKAELYFKDEQSCKYKIHTLTQYEKIKITYDGDPFDVWCSAGFIGENPYNVHTKYRVCVTPIDVYFGPCKVKPVIEFYDDFSIWATNRYNCRSPLPKRWCSNYERVQFKILADEKTSTHLTVEISVEADVSLSIAGAIGIAVGIVAGLILCCCCCYCCTVVCNDDKPTEETTATPPNVTGSNYDYRQYAQVPAENPANLNQTEYRRSTNDEFDDLLREGTASHVPMQEYGGGFITNPRFPHPQPSAPPAMSADPPSYQELFGKT